jgi:alpha-maltose-1-phosphate synthase
MRILFLCEGDAETHDSWSGVSRSLVRHLREAGHHVIAEDVDLHGATRFATAIRSLSPRLPRWRMRFRLGAAGFAARSARASQCFRRHRDRVDLVLQVGATFQVSGRGTHPLALYCDSNIELSRSAASLGVSEAALLTARELDDVRSREARVYDEAEVIFTMSDRLQVSFVDDFGIPPSRLCTVHCGPNVALDEVLAGGENAETARAAAPRAGSAQESDPFTILFVGRDFHRKGGALLLEAFTRVRRTHPGARLVMVGPPPPRNAIDGVEFTGYLSRDTPQGRAEMDRAYREADLFCLPTRFEPFGTSFVEAMFYGLPCVGPRAWAVPEIIEHEATGLLVPPDDPAALATAIAALLSDPSRTRDMGVASRQRALERFTWPGIVSRMEARLLPLVQADAPEAGERPGVPV